MVWSGRDAAQSRCSVIEKGGRDQCTWMQEVCKDSSRICPLPTVMLGNVGWGLVCLVVGADHVVHRASAIKGCVFEIHASLLAWTACNQLDVSYARFHLATL